MPDELTDPAQGQPSGDSGTAETLLAEVQRLRQDLAKSRDLNRQAEPAVKLTQALWESPGGKKIIEKLQQGKPLTELQEEKVAEATASEGRSMGLSPEQIQEIIQQELKQFAQADWSQRKAEREMEELDAKAAKELEGYENLRGNPEWNNQLSIVLNMIENKALIPPDDEPDPIYWAIKKTYQTVTGIAPGEKKERPAKKTETQRRAEILGQAGSQGGSPEDSSEPDSPELAWAKSRGSSTVGKSFSNS